MTITRRDVRLVYGSVAGGDVVATLPGAGGTGGPLASGFPLIQGTVPPTPPTADLFLDFNDGTSNDTLGITLGGQATANGQLPYRKHSWVPTGGFDGGGYIRMTWFTGMGIGFSPVWVIAPGGFTPHFELKYKVRQSNTMVHPGSSIKLLRLVNFDFTYRLGIMEWTNTGVGGGEFQRLKWAFDSFSTPARGFITFCTWDSKNDAGASCVPLFGGPENFIDGNWHEFIVECNYNDPEASTITVTTDGIKNAPVVQLNPASQSGAIIPPVGSTFYISPFCEMYSCGPQGCQADINSGTYDVDHFSYAILP